MNPTAPSPSSDGIRRLKDSIITAASMGGTLAEIAAMHEVSENWLATKMGREIRKAWARRAILIRQALTRAGLEGDIQALKRLTDLERREVLNVRETQEKLQ